MLWGQKGSRSTFQAMYTLLEEKRQQMVSVLELIAGVIAGKKSISIVHAIPDLDLLWPQLHDIAAQCVSQCHLVSVL